MNFKEIENVHDRIRKFLKNVGRITKVTRWKRFKIHLLHIYHVFHNSSPLVIASAYNRTFSVFSCSNAKQVNVKSAHISLILSPTRPNRCCLSS